MQEVAAKEEQWQKRADQRERERRFREIRKLRQQQVRLHAFFELAQSVSVMPYAYAHLCTGTMHQGMHTLHQQQQVYFLSSG